jgi:hypothetical protein
MMKKLFRQDLLGNQAIIFRRRRIARLAFHPERINKAKRSS